MTDVAPGMTIRDGLERAKAEGKQLGRPKRVFDRQKVLELQNQGLSLREIERKMKVSRRTLTRTWRSLVV
jgi:DNA invertase Pin-like site-specific DNA recombinase